MASTGYFSMAQWANYLGRPHTATLEQAQELEGLTQLIGEPGMAEQARRLLAKTHPTPIISLGGRRYRVANQEEIVDSETGERATLYYARDSHMPVQSGSWKLFFQDKWPGSELWDLTLGQVREHFLDPFLDEEVHVQKDEITFPRVVQRGAIIARGSGVVEQTLTFQNGHSIRLVWNPGRMGEQVLQFKDGSLRQITTPTPVEIERGLLKIPLPVLTQLDEVWIRNLYHPQIHARLQKVNGKKVLFLFPFEVTLETALTYNVSRVKEPELIRSWVLFNTLFHECFGHVLMMNKFLAREAVKIIAGGEKASSTYAETNIDEWFAEGVSNFWVLQAFDLTEEAEAWRRAHPYFSALLHHLLGILEEVVEPLNENLAAWQRDMRSLPS